MFAVHQQVDAKQLRGDPKPADNGDDQHGHAGDELPGGHAGDAESQHHQHGCGEWHQAEHDPDGAVGEEHQQRNEPERRDGHQREQRRDALRFADGGADGGDRQLLTPTIMLPERVEDSSPCSANGVPCLLCRQRNLLHGNVACDQMRAFLQS